MSKKKVIEPKPYDGMFKPIDSAQGFAKVGLFGFAGAGKTYTATEISIGLIKYLEERESPLAKRPVFFLDTEQGSDWVAPRFAKAGIELRVARTRSFTDLLNAVPEATDNASVLLVDSLTHFWKDLLESYQRKLRRKRLQFQDWGIIKPEWGLFADAFVTSNLNIVLAGRAGFEYDYFEDETGAKELEKTGIRMKAETEMGYEPSLVIYMDRHEEAEGHQVKRVWRSGTVLKDRSARLDGQRFENPTFDNFRPHFEFLTFQDQHAIDPSRNSEGRFDISGRPDWKVREERKTIALDEIAEVIKKHHPGQSAADKAARGDLMEEHFGTRSWKMLESLGLEAIEAGRGVLWLKLEGKPYTFQSPEAVIETDIP